MVHVFLLPRPTNPAIQGTDPLNTSCCQCVPSLSSSPSPQCTRSRLLCEDPGADKVSNAAGYRPAEDPEVNIFAFFRLSGAHFVPTHALSSPLPTKPIRSIFPVIHPSYLIFIFTLLRVTLELTRFLVGLLHIRTRASYAGAWRGPHSRRAERARSQHRTREECRFPVPCAALGRRHYLRQDGKAP